MITPQQSQHSLTARAALVVCIVPLACQTSTDLPRDVGLLLQTDASSYALQSDGIGFKTDIPYTFDNRTGAPVYLVNCDGAFALRLERWKGSEWVTAWAPFLNQCLSPPITILAETAFVDTLRVWGAPPNSNWHPAFDVAYPSGTYRIVWIDALSSFQRSLPFGDQIPIEYRLSNTFELTVD